MTFPDDPFGHRGFIAAAALTAGAVAALPGGIVSYTAAAAGPPQVPLPRRGMYDTVAAWTRQGPRQPGRVHGDRPASQEWVTVGTVAVATGAAYHLPAVLRGIRPALAYGAVST
ncbi:hypothetical protein OG361_06025 [Streptomyces sp. NBC_00090]|uniref:hypothetical protein n=1 Tax=Streptomyces sp. NBC_00090 TaxID=2903619 RepID=UPI003252B95B